MPGSSNQLRGDLATCPDSTAFLESTVPQTVRKACGRSLPDPQPPAEQPLPRPEPGRLGETQSHRCGGCCSRAAGADASASESFQNIWLERGNGEPCYTEEKLRCRQAPSPGLRVCNKRPASPAHKPPQRSAPKEAASWGRFHLLEPQAPRLLKGHNESSRFTLLPGWREML